MCELSLNEIGMVSGGVHDDKGGGGLGSSLSLGMAGSMGGWSVRWCSKLWGWHIGWQQRI
ncbi:hypothetical protein [Moraxella oculi]|uniref:Bacteriocin n=1 Tax=Moraxella oculi TaxID=2940516 RepID=A0ABW8UA33_9GAMM